MDKDINTILREVCEKAIAYDMAIQRYSDRQDAKQWTTGDNLDSLYFDWLEAAREGIEYLNKLSMNTNAIQPDVITEDMICDRCQEHQQQQPHTCPFAVEIDDDNESLCTCCEHCEEQCRMDI